MNKAQENTSLSIESLPVNALFATFAANFCAYTLSRKTIPLDNVSSIDDDSWTYIYKIITPSKSTIVSPTHSSIPKGVKFSKNYYTSHYAPPWLGSHFYETADFQDENHVVLDRAFETLQDPRPLIRWLRVLLKANRSSRAVVISPSAQIETSSRLPKNINHYREWNNERLLQFLQSAGFIIESTHITDSGNTIAVVSANEISHSKLIKASGLPSPRNSLIVTTEHADTKSTGGIGSYIKEVELTLDLDARPIVLVGSAEPFEKIMVTKEAADNILDLRRIIRNPSPTVHTTDWKSASVDMYKAVDELVFIYDQIHMIEFQEYQGIGARIVQAKQAEQLPNDVTCIVRGHGSQVYIDRASYDWSGMEKADVFELERLSIELADEVSLPTRYLKDLYSSTGYTLPENTHITRLPYSYPSTPSITYREVTKIIFLGKRSVMKGFPSFYAAISSLTDRTSTLYNPHINEVQVIAAHGDAAEFDEKLSNLLKGRNIKLSIGPLPRHEVLRTIQESAPHSIVCLPYGGDNHPVTILEMIANRSRFVAYGNGGIPELVPEPFRKLLISDPDQLAMAKKVREITEFNGEKILKFMNELHSAALSEQHIINTEVRESYLRKPTRLSKQLKNTAEYSDLATVLIPIYNTDLGYVEEAIESLNNQLLAPKEVLFINDKSPSTEYVVRLHKLIREKCRLNYRIIDHDINLGLAGARNTALAHCNTKYLINLDSDDVISTSFVYDYVRFMETHPGYSACTCALESFNDRDGWNTTQSDPDYSYVGLGNSLVLGVSKNIFGHAGSCVTVEDARKIGGWDASDRSKWEDWAFFLKMTSLGMSIFNFPKVNYYYRVSPASMARTYATYPGEMRIARNIAGLSIWESHRLYAFIKDEAFRTGGLMHSIEPDTLTYRIAKRISQGVNRVPVMKKVAKVVIQGSWDVTKKVKGKRR